MPFLHHVTCAWHCFASLHPPDQQPVGLAVYDELIIKSAVQILFAWVRLRRRTCFFYCVFVLVLQFFVFCFVFLFFCFWFACLLVFISLPPPHHIHKHTHTHTLSLAPSISSSLLLSSPLSLSLPPSLPLSLDSMFDVALDPCQRMSARIGMPLFPQHEC